MILQQLCQCGRNSESSKSLVTNYGPKSQVVMKSPSKMYWNTALTKKELN